MALPWFKFYAAEYLSDPKIGNLSAQERSCWITLLCIACSSNAGGLIEFLTTEVLLEKSGIQFNPYQTDEWDNCLSILSKFERMRMIKKNENGTIEILNWAKRQDGNATATERSRKFRLKSRINQPNATDETKCNKNETTDKIRVDKIRVDKNKDNKQGEQSSQEKLDPINQIFEVFYKTVNPAINYGNKTNRKAADWMIKKWGLENVIRIAEFACAVQGQQYAPTITTPGQLKEKSAQLKIYKEKQEKKENKSNIKIGSIT